MAELIEVKVPFSKSAHSVSKTLEGRAKQVGPFKYESISVSIQPLPEIQEWIDDGRIVSYDISGSWKIGSPRLNTFRFSDPDQAMMFKLIYG